MNIHLTVYSGHSRQQDWALSYFDYPKVDWKVTCHFLYSANKYFMSKKIKIDKDKHNNVDHIFFCLIDCFWIDLEDSFFKFFSRRSLLVVHTLSFSIANAAVSIVLCKLFVIKLSKVVSLSGVIFVATGLVSVVNESIIGFKSPTTAVFSRFILALLSLRQLLIESISKQEYKLWNQFNSFASIKKNSYSESTNVSSIDSWTFWWSCHSV